MLCLFHKGHKTKAKKTTKKMPGILKIWYEDGMSDYDNVITSSVVKKVLYSCKI